MNVTKLVTTVIALNTAIISINAFSAKTVKPNIDAIAIEADNRFNAMAEVVFKEEYENLKVLRERANYSDQLSNISRQIEELIARKRALKSQHKIVEDPRSGSGLFPGGAKYFSTYPQLADPKTDSRVVDAIRKYQSLEKQIDDLVVTKIDIERTIKKEKKNPGSSIRMKELIEAEQDLADKIAALKKEGIDVLEKKHWAARRPRVDGLDHDIKFRLSDQGRAAYGDYANWVQGIRRTLGQKTFKRLGIVGAALTTFFVGSIASQQAHAIHANRSNQPKSIRLRPSGYQNYLSSPETGVPANSQNAR